MAAKKRPTGQAEKKELRRTTSAPLGTSAKLLKKAKPSEQRAALGKARAPALNKEAGRASSDRSGKSPAGKSASSKAASSKAKPSSAALGEGDVAPKFESIDQRGEPVSSEDLSGKPYVLYFYPKNDTPGCTVEACEFRDAASNFERAGVRVIGVSPDSPTSHDKFRAKYNLPFTLLSDGEQRLASAYGTWSLKKNYGREYMGIVRSTFLVGADGVIKKVWRAVRVNGHVAAVHTAAEQLS